MSEAINQSRKTYFIDLFRDKWHHFVFWPLYLLFWFVLSGDSFTLDSIIINIIFLTCAMVPTYMVSYYFLPKLLKHQRYLSFFLSLVVSIIAFAALLYLLLRCYYDYAGIKANNFLDFPIVLGPTLGSVAISVLGFFTAKTIKDNIYSERLNRQLKQEKIETELMFLKSQLNPHFLFNILNNIYFLIKKDQDLAADSLAQFSDIMRYQIYECQDKKVPLSSELDFIKNYIQLSSMAKLDTTKITVDIVEPKNESISPLLIIPLIENVFKHIGTNSLQENFIDIKISLKEGQLYCFTKNTFDKSNSNKKDKGIKTSGGLGLNNLERRLELLYPNNHEFMTLSANEIFTSKLIINL